MRSLASASALPSCLLVALLLLAGSAGAQEEGAEPERVVADQDADVAQRAREQFVEGVTHFQARDFRAAIHSWEVAAELVPSADLWFNIARAYEELAEWERAIEHYRRYLRDRVDPPDQRTVEAHIVSLEERAEAARQAAHEAPTTGTLALRTRTRDASVSVDERQVGRSPISDDLEIDPGSHSLLLERDGYVPFRAEVGVEAGVRTAAYAELVPETRYRAITSDRIWTWISFGLAAAALGTSIGLGIEAGSRQGTSLDSAREWAAWSDVALGAGIGFGALGLVLFFVEGRAVGTEEITVDADADLDDTVAPRAVDAEETASP